MLKWSNLFRCKFPFFVNLMLLDLHHLKAHVAAELEVEASGAEDWHKGMIWWRILGKQLTWYQWYHVKNGKINWCNQFTCDFYCDEFRPQIWETSSVSPIIYPFPRSIISHVIRYTHIYILYIYIYIYVIKIYYIYNLNMYIHYM